MSFLYEKQSRFYCIFLGAFCAALLCFTLLSGRLQAEGTKNVLLERERAIASSLLSQGVSTEVIAAAFGNGAVTEEGIVFLEKIGRSRQTDPELLPLVRESAAGFLLYMLSGAAGMSAVLLAGAFCFLSRREKLYQEAEGVIAEFADGNFSRHLSRNQEGTLYQMFDAVDQLSIALQAKGETAVRAGEALKDAVSDISHQLKTPLSALAMYTEIILDEPDDPQTVREFAQKAACSLRRMETLVQTLLKVMRLDAGSVLFEKSVCRVSELAAEAAGELRTRAEQEQKRILPEGDPEGTLLCDPAWTVEALSNLIKNALDHTAAGGVIRIGWQRSFGMLRLWVEDDGCGIDPEDMPYIFRRFYRSKNSSDTQGAGLGLALVRSITEGQGGNVSVRSETGRGTVFYLTFPDTE